MFSWILSGIVLVVIIGFFTAGYPRIALPRKASFKGIESPEVKPMTVSVDGPNSAC